MPKAKNKPKKTERRKKSFLPVGEKSRQEIEFRQAIKEDIRPWGKFRSYPFREAGAIKIVTVNPQQALSLQLHKKRSEFWVVLDEGLEMTLGDKIWLTKPGEEIFIPRGTPHRLRCFGQAPARVMEIWIGKRSSEKDIVRLEDIYGRA